MSVASASGLTGGATASKRVGLVGVAGRAPALVELVERRSPSRRRRRLAVERRSPADARGSSAAALAQLGELRVVLGEARRACSESPRM